MEDDKKNQNEDDQKNQNGRRQQNLIWKTTKKIQNGRRPIFLKKQ